MGKRLRTGIASQDPACEGPPHRVSRSVRGSWYGWPSGLSGQRRGHYRHRDRDGVVRGTGSLAQGRLLEPIQQPWIEFDILVILPHKMWGGV